MRKKLMRFFFLFIITLLISSTFMISHAASFPYVTTSNGFVSQSPYNNLCWSACTVSMVQVKGYSTSVFNNTVNALGAFLDVTRTIYQLKTDFKSIYNLNTSVTANYISLTSISSDIGVNKPIMSRIGWSGGGGHFVLISGIESLNAELYVMDPYYGWQYPSYSSLKSNYRGSGTWTHTLRYQ